MLTRIISLFDTETKDKRFCEFVIAIITSSPASITYIARNSLTPGQGQSSSDLDFVFIYIDVNDN